jgi:biofilm PGA synthesis N-glycosyltransferase PgaC
MKLLFWASSLQIAYTYFGYPLMLWFMSKLRPSPVRRSVYKPSVSIIIAARNEETNLPAKLVNLKATEYPREHLQVVVASDGSTDRTEAILVENEDFIEPVLLKESRGKGYALNRAVERASGEILVFQDARQYVHTDAVGELVSCFADPSVGAVSGELDLRSESGAAALGIYWKLEKTVRKLECATGSVVGVTGALYALRHELFTEIPPGTILDDVFLPMNVVRRGKRVVFHSSAIAVDRVFHDSGKEFRRKVRTLTGNYQLLRIEPWLLSWANPLLFRFVSHKLFRLVVPLSLAAMLVSSGLAYGAFYRTVFGLQLAFYCMAAIGVFSPPARKLKLVAVANTFVMLNVAAALAFYNFIARRERVWA